MNNITDTLARFCKLQLNINKNDTKASEQYKAGYKAAMETSLGFIELMKQSIFELLKTETYDESILHQWYIDSVLNMDGTVWTDEQVAEIADKFYLLPRYNENDNLISYKLKFSLSDMIFQCKRRLTDAVAYIEKTSTAPDSEFSNGYITAMNDILLETAKYENTINNFPESIACNNKFIKKATNLIKSKNIAEMLNDFYVIVKSNE